jgi:anti-sigma-K factor RskA
MDYSRPDLADRLAADYVAGTLRGPARRRLEALLPAHPVLRDAVLDWQDRLAPLSATIAPETPPAVVWQRIEARLGGAVSGIEPARLRWWQRLVVWQTATALAGGAVLSMAMLLGSPGPVEAPIVVVLSPAEPAPGAPAGGVVPASLVASISADGRALVTRPLTTNLLPQADRALELWAVPAQGAPRSLGLISGQGATVVKRGKVLDNTAALAVSLEPPGGSTTGAPSGPVLYVGKLVF